MANEEILKAIFPFLDGTDLASCMVVCKQWKDIAQDDYFWKCLCARRWPSICKQPNPPTVTYRKFYQTFYKRQICKQPNPPTVTYRKLYQTFYERQNRRTLPRPRLSFKDLEFFIDIWAEDKLIFSEVVPDPVLQHGMKIPPTGTPDMLGYNLEHGEYKMAIPVDPRFTVNWSQTVSVSVLLRRKDSNRVACIINKPEFEHIDCPGHRVYAFEYLDFSPDAYAFEYLDFSPDYPFTSRIQAWIALCFVEEGNKSVFDDVFDVFGVEMDFWNTANSEEEVLWLLDMLDWK